MVWKIVTCTLYAAFAARLGSGTPTASPATSLATGLAAEANAAAQVINTDVVIIGGGATGTYAAVKLRDAGVRVQVIEQRDRLGGHTQTYQDPISGGRTETGVVIYENISATTAFAQRLGVPLVPVNLGTGAGETLVDFRTGKALPPSPYTESETAAALEAYAEQLAKYPYLDLGFDLAYPVPSDLLLSFGDFVKKYKLDAAVPVISQYDQGVGNILNQTAIYPLKLFGLQDLISLKSGYLTTARGDNSELYTRAAAIIGPSRIQYRSTVAAMQRSTDATQPHLLRLQGPAGPLYIHAKRILSTIPPVLANLSGWDLDANERSLFGRFNNSAYYTAIVNKTGLPANMTFYNATSNTPYELPVLPGIYGISLAAPLPGTSAQPIPGAFNVKYGAPSAMSSDAVKADIVSEIQRLQKAQGLKVTTPGFVFFDSHTPYELVVPAKAIAGGFYKDLYALQGRKGTWWTGAAWHTHNSALLWRFTDGIVEDVVESLKAA